MRFKISPLPILPSLLGFVGIMAAIYFLTDGVYGRSLLGCVIGMFSCYLLLGIRLKIHWLAKIGIYSYSIYIFHVFFTAASRIIVTKIVELPVEVKFLIGITVGILGPIFVYQVAVKTPYTSLSLLGQKHVSTR